MIHGQDIKPVVVIAPQAIGTTAVTGVIDTLGFDYVQVLSTHDTAATSVTITTYKLSEGDTTSSYDDIAAFTGGTATDNFTLPVGPGTSGVTAQLGLLELSKVNHRKRYLKVTLANSASRISSVHALLSRGKGTPVSATERGVAFLKKG